MRIAAGNLEVGYDDAGTGPPVVFVHGGLGNRAMWRPQVAALRERYRCLTYDLRGHGETTGGEDVEAFTPALLRDDLLAFADALGLARFHLVGLSVGGFVGQETAIARPERVDRLVLADTWVVTSADARMREVGRLLSPVVEVALRVAGTAPLAALGARGMGADRPEAAELVREATAGTSPEAAIRVWRGLSHHDTRERLSRITAPTLVLVGERDHNVEQSRLLARSIAGAELKVLSDAGHVSNLAAPEAFNAALEAFLGAESSPLRSLP